MDIDQSGNYDPKEERKQARAKKLKVKESKKKAAQPKAPKVRIAKMIVRLRFRSRFGTVLNITDGQDNWPKGWSDIDSENERLVGERRLIQRDKTPGVVAQPVIPDSAFKEDDLTGHPAARGCAQCRIDETECSMVHGGTWPCAKCKAQNEDCQLLIPPIIMGRCQNCEEADEEFCSFEEERNNHSFGCDQCMFNDRGECIGKPIEGYKHTRIDLDEYTYGAKRKYVDCSNCRANNKRCSIKNKTQRGPCRHCKKSKIKCDFLENAPPSATNIIDVDTAKLSLEKIKLRLQLK